MLRGMFCEKNLLRKVFFSRSFPKPFIKKRFCEPFGLLLKEIKALRRLIGALFLLPIFFAFAKKLRRRKRE